MIRTGFLWYNLHRRNIYNFVWDPDFHYLFINWISHISYLTFLLYHLASRWVEAPPPLVLKQPKKKNMLQGHGIQSSRFHSAIRSSSYEKKIWFLQSHILVTEYRISFEVKLLVGLQVCTYIRMNSYSFHFLQTIDWRWKGIDKQPEV